MHSPRGTGGTHPHGRTVERQQTLYKETIHLKKLASLFLALTLCAGLAAPALAAEFSDVPADHPFYDAIADCSEKGIVGGYPDGTFQPTNAVTKNHFCAMLARAFYADTVAEYDTDYIKTTYGTFGPTNRALAAEKILANASFQWAYDDASAMSTGIDRCDMAQLMTNIMNGKGFFASESDKNAASSKIADYADVPSQYRDAVLNVYALGIIGGFSDGTFGGAVTINRGQAAVVIYRLAQYVGDGSGTGPAVSAGDDLTEVPNSPGSTPAGQEASGNAENGALTLRDGSAVTEENALKIIDEILKVYPSGTTWDDNTSRVNSTLINNRELGSKSTTVQNIANIYGVAMQKACGGFAGLVSDSIFGGGNNGGNSFPGRKLDSVSQVRPGDIIIKMGPDGKQQHFLTAASSVKDTAVKNGVTLYYIDTYEGNMNGSVVYNNSGVRYITDDLYRGSYYEVWTRYPD